MAARPSPKQAPCLIISDDVSFNWPRIYSMISPPWLAWIRPEQTKNKREYIRWSRLCGWHGSDLNEEQTIISTNSFKPRETRMTHESHATILFPKKIGWTCLEHRGRRLQSMQTPGRSPSVDTWTSSGVLLFHDPFTNKPNEDWKQLKDKAE